VAEVLAALTEAPPIGEGEGEGGEEADAGHKP
jgi:hypothetical protein